MCVAALKNSRQTYNGFCSQRENMKRSFYSNKHGASKLQREITQHLEHPNVPLT